MRQTFRAHADPVSASNGRGRVMSDVKWTMFLDMSSGGGEKLDFSVAWVEAPEEEAGNQ